MFLITHDDLDGLACAILAKLAWNDIEVKLAKSPKDVDTILGKMVEASQLSKTYITDCSCSEEWFKHSKMELRLFDHHKTAMHLQKYSNATVKIELDHRKTCGAELFHNYLVKHGHLAARNFFIELVRKYDTWDWVNDDYKFPAYLNDLIGCISTQVFINSFIEKLRYHDINELTLFTNDERIMVNTIQNLKYKYIKSAIENAYKTDDNKVYITFASEYISELGNEMLKHCKIACIVNINSHRLSFRSKDNVDVSAIAQKFEGGGHTNAAGGYLNENMKNDICLKILERIKE